MTTEMDKSRAAAPAPRLLVVDDMPEILEIFSRIVQRLPTPVVVETISDPRAAVRRLEEEDYDAVFCDFRMPHLDGADVLAIARKMQPRAKLAILTGYNELPDAHARLREAQIDAYLKKPIAAARLLDVLRAFLCGEEDILETFRAEARAQENDTAETRS